MAVLLFDGVCNFCHGAVRFIVARDPAGYFQFAPLQSEVGARLLDGCGMPATALETMVLIDDDGCHTASDAALRIAGRLSGVWPLLKALWIVPRPVRDRLYRFVVDHRYRWFGRRDTCGVPTPELRSRFLA